jgi:long-subunit acyl-CoA synthetase (AMP-forming)
MGSGMTLTHAHPQVDRAPGFDAATLCEAFQLTAKAFADSPALRAVGDPRPLTWAEYAQRVERIAGGLARRGVRRGDAVALMLRNRPEFNLLDMALLHLGATPFSIYNTSSPEQIAYLFSNAANRLVLTERRFVEVLRAAGSDVEIVVIEDGLPDGAHPDFEASWRAVQPADIATLIYTSGTTGPPKGVQLSHANLMAALNHGAQSMYMRPAGRLMSYLPCAHVADRFIGYYIGVATGSSITSVDDPKAILAGLVDARPTCWLAVPRIWEKLRAALEAKGLTDPAALPAQAKADTRVSLGLDQADWVLSGAAPIAPETLEYLMALGLPVVEGWAMSETSCAGTVNPLGAVRVGTVGKPMGGIEVSLAEDGELLLRGANVMVGYRNAPEQTAEVIDPDGWLRTGDIAEIDADGYVKIVDRKKELIINAAGKNMSPANIEQKLKAASPLIGQVCVIGDARPYNVALLVLDPDGAAAHARAHGLDPEPAMLATHPGTLELIGAAVAAANARMSRVEQIKRFTVLGVDWLPDGDELTPTMKLKRRGVAAKYAAEIEALYA